MTPQMTEALKKVFALGQVRPCGWSDVQIPVMLPRRKLYVAICTIDSQRTGKNWAANMERGLQHFGSDMRSSSEVLSGNYLRNLHVVTKLHIHCVL